MKAPPGRLEALLPERVLGREGQGGAGTGNGCLYHLAPPSLIVMSPSRRAQVHAGHGIRAGDSLEPRAPDCNLIGARPPG